jgi:ferrous iron transport protein A
MKKSRYSPHKTHSTLSALPPGRWATVLNVLGPGFIALRLMEMGLVPGASIAVVRSAPLGDPLQIKLRDYHLALRRTEAEMIRVALDGD